MSTVQYCTGIIYRMSDWPGCLWPLLLESVPYLTAVSEIGKAAIAGDAVIVWMQPRKTDSRNLFPLGRSNCYWHSLWMADWRGLLKVTARVSCLTEGRGLG